MTHATAALTAVAYYVVVLALLPALARAWLGVPAETARKGQHVAFFLAIFLWLEAFTAWTWAVTTIAAIAVLAYATLYRLEDTPTYRRTLTDRAPHGGELRRQIVYAHVASAALIAATWGALGPEGRYLAAAAMMASGAGDLAAFVVGRTYGRTSFPSRHVASAKTVEGSAAMLVAAFAAVTLTLALYGGLPWPASALAGLWVAPAASTTELLSRRGSDTLTVPLVSGAALLAFHLLVWGTGF